MTMYCCCTTPIILLIVVYFGVAWCPNYCNAYATSSVNTVNQQQQQQQQQQQNVDVCNPDRLAVYKVVLHTYWTRELFPKHYPDWRPPAQWTKTFGRSHDDTFNLYRIGRTASPGMKLFVETGRSDTLDGQFTKEGSIFDEFTIPAIPNGSGRSEIKFFVDGNHTMVSLMTRIVPSPDWFIGVDSFQLCVGGSWIDTVTVELDPLDAGTDNGFTFTAPNWPTDPQGIIYRITSRYPSHPAGSFFYPQNKRLPPIATVQFIKLKEYELSEVFHYAEDDRKYETISTKTHLEMEHNQIDMNNELSATIEQERQHEMTQKPSIFTEKDKIRAKLLAKMNPITNTTQPSSISSTIIQQYQPSLSLSALSPISSPSSSSSSSSSALSTIQHQYILPKNNKNAILNNIARTYASKSTKKHKKQRHLRPPKDCRVGHWSDWSACSKTCGIGEMHRYRKVIKHSKRGGRPCPPLQESKWCGSAKDCNSPSGYFKW